MPDDFLILTPDDIDLSRSPLAGRIDAETFVLGAFNPALTRLPSGNLLLMVRVAEALRDPQARSIRWDEGRCRLDCWPADAVDLSDPRIIRLTREPWSPIALTSLSWLLPVELSPDGARIERIHYARAIVPHAAYQCYGVEDPRISRIGDRYLMTVCSVSPERLGTTLYTSADGLDWTCEGLILDHQNKDMLIFEGMIDGKYWAQTRPLGETWCAYPSGSAWRAGPAINLASSPDALHWRPHAQPGLRPLAGHEASVRMGGGTPPIRTREGWLSLWHAVAPGAEVGIYRTYWSLLDAAEPWRVLHRDPAPLIEPAPHLTARIADQAYLGNVVFTTGIIDAGDHYLVASGEADLACRMTRIAKARLA